MRYEFDLRPFASGGTSGTKGGTFPYAVVLDGSIAYVSCDRDREVVAVNIAGTGSVVARIQLDGNPNGMALSANPLLESRSRQRHRREIGHIESQIARTICVPR